MEASAYLKRIRRRVVAMVVAGSFLILGAATAYLFGRPVVGTILLFGGFVPICMAGVIGSASEDKGCLWFAAGITIWLAFMAVLAWAAYANLFR